VESISFITTYKIITVDDKLEKVHGTEIKENHLKIFKFRVHQTMIFC